MQQRGMGSGCSRRGERGAGVAVGRGQRGAIRGCVLLGRVRFLAGDVQHGIQDHAASRANDHRHASPVHRAHRFCPRWHMAGAHRGRREDAVRMLLQGACGCIRHE
ncbi:unnamed protein product, partial [Sphacelaria rigidula]